MYAPWKRDFLAIRLPVNQNQTVVKRSAGPCDDQVAPKWTCSRCTYINEPTSNKCWTCETPPPAESRRTSPNRFESAPDYRLCFIATDVAGANQERAPSPGIIKGTMNESTQTEGLDTATGNAAQRVIGRLRQIVSSRTTPASSRENSPQTRTAEVHWTAPDSPALWACSNCGHENTMSQTECQRCGLEEANPVAIVSSQSAT